MNEPIINARSAYNQTYSTKMSFIKSELDEIMKLIRCEIDKGNYSFSSDIIYSDKCIKKLKELGYEVNISSDRNQSIITISWENPEPKLDCQYFKNDKPIDPEDFITERY